MTKSYQREKEDFLLTMQAEGMAPEITRRILRHANTIQRCAYLECSNEAADRDRVKCPSAIISFAQLNGERCLCRDYGSADLANNQHGTVPRIAVTTENAERAIARLCESLASRERCTDCLDVPGKDGLGRPCKRCEGHGDTPVASRFVPHFQGDPRGACVKIQVPSGRYDSMGGATEGVCVPTREY